jgi:hypothetical protein
VAAPTPGASDLLDSRHSDRYDRRQPWLFPFGVRQNELAARIEPDPKKYSREQVDMERRPKPLDPPFPYRAVTFEAGQSTTCWS